VPRKKEAKKKERRPITRIVQALLLFLLEGRAIKKGEEKKVGQGEGGALARQGGGGPREEPEKNPRFTRLVVLAQKKCSLGRKDFKKIDQEEGKGLAKRRGTLTVRHAVTASQKGWNEEKVGSLSLDEGLHQSELVVERKVGEKLIKSDHMSF